MKLGIIGAMEEELVLIRNKINAKAIKTKAGKTFYKGEYMGVDIILTECGVGKVNAAVTTQILIDDFTVEKVICTGVAGALNRALNVKDTVISKDVIQHDIDVSEDGYPKGYIPRLKIREIKADNDLIITAVNASKKILSDNKVHVGRILTGDQFIASDEASERLRKEFNGDCVEMEGGAIAQTCYLNNVPFVIIRSISDNANNMASTDYDSFVHDACRNSFLIVMSMIEEIAQEKDY